MLAVASMLFFPLACRRSFDAVKRFHFSIPYAALNHTRMDSVFLFLESYKRKTARSLQDSDSDDSDHDERDYSWYSDSGSDSDNDSDSDSGMSTSFDSEDGLEHSGEVSEPRVHGYGACSSHMTRRRRIRNPNSEINSMHDTRRFSYSAVFLTK